MTTVFLYILYIEAHAGLQEKAKKRKMKCKHCRMNGILYETIAFLLCFSVVRIKRKKRNNNALINGICFFIMKRML